ncbi:hypothetical protein LINPERPRIM_LOCUS30092, partial [Linum perenne]
QYLIAVYFIGSWLRFWRIVYEESSRSSSLKNNQRLFKVVRSRTTFLWILRHYII